MRRYYLKNNLKINFVMNHYESLHAIINNEKSTFHFVNN